MYKILTLNNISVAGLERLPRDQYEVASEIQHQDAILLRSFNITWFFSSCCANIGWNLLLDLLSAKIMLRTLPFSSFLFFFLNRN